MTEEELREETGQEKTEEETVEEKTETEEPVQEEAEEAVEGTVEDQPKEEEKPEADERDAKIEELNGRYLRLMAEFDNYRKRTDKEKASQFQDGEAKVLTNILNVVDSFERGMQSVPEEKRDDPVFQGMDKIYKQLMKTLTDLGVEPINAEGKPFDLTLHNAVMQVENDELEENTVAAELQKGYTFKGTVLRHSMVSVVK
ncbi:MAG: nucleotide exchange factor GrpE [Lachnospiraceae bacterium]|nr:nucleotide exchange factor GrpE [Lachnospiraceae bacterium]